jgi:two-component system chemotaxis response regulator CheY
VTTAIDGSEGLEKLYANPTSLILTDINMSNMDGYEFIRRVRANERYNSVPIVIVSTQSEAKDRTKGFEAGANLYICKPCSPDMMLENIRMILFAN